MTENTNIQTSQLPTIGQSGGGRHMTEKSFQRLSALVAQEMVNNPKMAGVIQSAFDIFTAAFYKPEAAMTSTDVLRKANASSALSSLDKLDELSKSKGTIFKAGLPAGLGDPNAQVFKTSAFEIKDVLARLRTGAVINEDEMKLYESKIPKWYDTQENIDIKLNQFRSFFSELYSRGATAPNQSYQTAETLPAIGGGY